MRIPDICPFLHLFWGLKVENSHETQKNLRPGQGGSVLYKIQSTKINRKIKAILSGLVTQMFYFV